MRVLATNQNILRLALPISLALAIPQISFLANTAFLGRVGERELGINGIAGIFYLLLSMIGYGLSSGLQVQMARRAGEGDKTGLTKTVMNCLMLSELFALGLMVLSLWFAPLIFGLSLRDSSNIFLSIDYLFLRVWGLPFLMLTQLANAFFISIHKSRFLIYGSVAGTLTNIVFDYLLIFGEGGFPVMGLQGAALASILGEIAFCATMFGGYFFNRIYREYPIHHYLSFDAPLSSRSLRIASPLIVQYMFSIGGWQIFFIFIEHLGNRELAASQILRSIFGIVSIGTWAMAATCNTMVSNVIGQGKEREVLYVIKKIAKISLIYTVCVSILLLAFSDQFLSLYRDDPILVAFSKPSLRVIVLASMIMSLSTVLFNGVVGTGNTLINLTIEVTCVFTYLIYCYIVIERLQLPLHWAWGSEFVYWTSLLLISFAYLKSGRWKGKRI